MPSRKESFCRTGLRPGMIVKDRAGLRKVVTRIEHDKVYWEYLNSAKESPRQRETSTPYEDFADSHFVTPERVPLDKAA